MMNRRDFLKVSATTMALLGVGRWLHGEDPDPDGPAPATGFGDLIADPNGILDLPRGFQARVIGVTNAAMADGQPTPGRPDGMAAFPGPNGTVLLVCNHENDPRQGSAFWQHPNADRIFDGGHRLPPAGGGTTTLRYAPQTGTAERWLSLAGTLRNCAGGPTPWGSWLSCEESVAVANGKDLERDHGWVFEVPATAEPELIEPRPITAMGRFNHEAAAVHPNGPVYLSEDRSDGCFYRFLPTQAQDLHAGGRLQALMISGHPGVSTIGGVPVGTSLPVQWLDCDQVESPNDDLRQRMRLAGAATFTRGEGLWMDGSDACWLTCTSGGPRELGQVWVYRPAPGEGTADEQAGAATMTLVAQPTSAAAMRHPDNITVTPWGDALVAEDGPPGNRLIGVRPDGSSYLFARNRYNGSELAGICFAPDGQTAFVNIQHPGITLAITGPFPSR